MSLKRRDLYHIEFERSENISISRSENIEQTLVCISTEIKKVIKNVLKIQGIFLDCLATTEFAWLYNLKP